MGINVEGHKNTFQSSRDTMNLLQQRNDIGTQFPHDEQKVGGAEGRVGVRVPYREPQIDSFWESQIF